MSRSGLHNKKVTELSEVVLIRIDWNRGSPVLAVGIVEKFLFF